VGWMFICVDGNSSFSYLRDPFLYRRFQI
jgi:hypothetical protein